ncbi:glycoside hydrolase family 3 N-terminal domain-containing protein [Ignavibacterium sp.]|uniref:glycoside hydrolase family 3 N-terminal domain-containing protein n=1 Tax=Ignavibacterium sp. TaxID=2651167 RepID=UPI00220EE9F5|nr:glycoside hydrolase family 3 N-terminal domain-containing protein [Ignavibacterium sp.]BDQ02897.1 MAG: glycosyl hydrolase [Ignavibacterium sp.]
MKLITFLCLLTISLTTTEIISQKKNSDIEKKVKNLLSQMTLEEKVGQMTQVTLQVVSKKQGTKNQHHELDEAKLEEAILKYHVGSILNVYDVAHESEYWHEVITKIQNIAQKTRLKIPVIYGIDAIHGATYTKGATLFPQALAVASTWNKDIAKRIGEITSIETRASGIPWNFYPVMDIGRQPLWPRLWETFGEDVFLASELGVNYIKGAQGDDISRQDKLATCLKHYVGYSFPLNGLDRTPAWISERMMREYFLPSFEAGILAGSPTIMVNSAEVDGIPGHANYHLLTEVLRDELKFKGFVVSDWEDIKRLYTRDRVASSPKEAVRLAVMAGVDMSMVPQDYSFYDLLLELVKEGKVPMKRIDEAVSRILSVKFQLGLFENPFPNKELLKNIATEEHKQANLNAARESIILAKNDDDFLPLKKDKKVFVTGPTANMLSPLNGGWTITWQGNEESLYPQEKNTILEAIKSKVGESNVKYMEGCSFDADINSNEAYMEATNSDVIVLCLGEPAYCETPGNIYDLTLPKAQLDYTKKLIATGKPIVLVMVEGRPRVITEIAKDVKSILLAFLPGMEGGNAIADIIYGDENPSGKLPVTYPKSPNGITLYDYKPLEYFDENKYNPLFPFGHGLSYTKFKYSNLKLSSDKIKMNEKLVVSVDVENVGKIKGKEVVQLYLTDLYGSVSRPNKQLKGFEKIELNPGEQKTVTFTIDKSHLSFIGIENKRIAEPGEFVITIGDLKKNFFVE